MEYSQNGLLLTEGFEALRTESYQDIKGIWTIGFGHTLNVIPGMTCTEEQANTWLAEDVHSAESCINVNVRVELTQNEFDALVDFAFNCGNSAFKQSTMLQLLNQGDYAGAANEFDKWDHASGKVVAGLLRRRQAETDLFNKDQKERTG